jgi:hypothetical protein
MKKVVDLHQINTGYLTPIERMLEQLSNLGARTYFLKRLTGLFQQESGDSTLKLAFSDNTTVDASRVLLNLPPSSLQHLDNSSVVFTNATRAALAAMGQPGPLDLVKVYLQYDDAWWVTRLGLVEGTFENVTTQPPIKGRYHDGPMKCRIGEYPPDGGGPTRPSLPGISLSVSVSVSVSVF